MPSNEFGMKGKHVFWNKVAIIGAITITIGLGTIFGLKAVFFPITPTPTEPDVVVNIIIIGSNDPLRSQIEMKQLTTIFHCTDNGIVSDAIVTLIPSEGVPPYKYQVEYSSSNIEGPFTVDKNSPITLKIDGGKSAILRIKSNNETEYKWVWNITVPSTTNKCFTPNISQDQLGIFSSSDIRNANMSFSYPTLMRPRNSNLVTLTLQGVGELLNEKIIPTPSIVALSPDIPIETSRFGFFSDNLIVAPQMYADLTSQSFDIQPEFTESVKDVDVENPTTEWSWSIKAPDSEGVHLLVLKIFLDNAKDPIYLRGFEIGVTLPTNTPLAPTHTPTLTFTPVQTSTQTLTPTPIPISQTPAFITGITVAIIALIGTVITVLGNFWIKKLELNNRSIKDSQTDTEPTEKNSRSKAKNKSSRKKES